MNAHRIAAASACAAVLLASCFTPADAWQSPQQPTAPPDQVRLQWKFAEGQTSFYTLDESITRTSTFSGRRIQTTERRLYHYKWEVAFELGADNAGVVVEFGRVRHELTTPDGKIVADTYAPLDPQQLSPDARRLQEEAYRILQTRFMFLTTRAYSSAWPEDVGLGSAIPKALLRPEASALFLPQRFTSGSLSLVLPAGPIAVGDHWTQEVDGGMAHGAWRIVDRVQRQGRECWRIEGVMTLDAPQKDPKIWSQTAGPETSDHYVDVKSGELVESQVVIPVRAVYANGAVLETTVRIQRKLEGEPFEQVDREVSRKLADGEVRTFVYRNGSPLNVKQDWLGVLQSGVLVHGEETDKERRPEAVSWSLILHFGDRKVRSVRLFDVTREPMRELEASPLGGEMLYPATLFTFDFAKLGSPEAQWLTEGASRERITKIVVEDEAGETITLYQPTLLPLKLLREDVGLPDQE